MLCHLGASGAGICPGEAAALGLSETRVVARVRDLVRDAFAGAEQV